MTSYQDLEPLSQAWTLAHASTGDQMLARAADLLMHKSAGSKEESLDNAHAAEVLMHLASIHYQAASL